ncbi:MAG: class I SAM-dependent methyltransferase [Candidatus Loosdrechtia sp.]|uniref:class I SAM-dependent methyltransferase n=1 Tax=Candidatus Loosdrechtia sp. TaxID=3101272 RepID=UPI003A5D7B2E|nr:MAG: class I SAM-dependent methyltransferase [Candidatus Jettenia sp. AMX2]
MVSPTARVLEVGPGSGAFTIPLAAAVREVVVVEPSLAMRQVLNRNLAAAGLGNVRIVPQPFETGLTALEGSFDLALASHSLYHVEMIDTVLHGLLKFANHIVILLGIGEELAWYQALYRQFKNKEPLPSAHFRYFYSVLLELGIYADVKLIWTSSNYVYNSEDTMVEWWLNHFHLNAARQAEMRVALRQISERRGDQVGIYDRRRIAFIWIERERNVVCKNNLSINA